MSEMYTANFLFAEAVRFKEITGRSLSDRLEEAAELLFDDN